MASTAELRIECGPHPRKRHGRASALVAFARIGSIGGHSPIVLDFYGLTEQRLYVRADGTEEWEEYTASPGPAHAPKSAPTDAYERDDFDERWARGQAAADSRASAEALGLPPLATEVAVRERAVLRCPVCRRSVPFANADEARTLAVMFAGAGMPSVTLDMFARAHRYNHAEQGTQR